MKKYEEIIKGQDPFQCALALEYLLRNGRENLQDDVYYQNLQDNIKDNDDSRSGITNGYALDSLKIARDMAKLDTKELCEYIYDEVKYQKEQEKKLKNQERSR